MISIIHSLKFVTEFDETNPHVKRLLELSNETQVAMLESMLKEMLTPELKPILEKLNKNNSYATLKVAK